MYSHQTDSYFMDAQLVEGHEPRNRFLKQCHHCLKVLDGNTRTELFTRYGWHLRLAHYQNWGKR